MSTLERPVVVVRHRSSVASFALSAGTQHQHRKLVTACQDNSVSVFDVPTGCLDVDYPVYVTCKRAASHPSPRANCCMRCCWFGCSHSHTIAPSLDAYAHTRTTHSLSLHRVTSSGDCCSPLDTRPHTRLQFGGTALAVAFSPDSRYLAVGLSTGVLLAYAALTYKPIGPFTPHTEAVRLAPTPLHARDLLHPSKKNLLPYCSLAPPTPQVLLLVGVFLF
jgi:hypothetical protein